MAICPSFSPSTGDWEVIDAPALGAAGDRKHVAEAIKLLLPRRMHSGVHPVQPRSSALANVLVRVNVLLHFMEAALVQHVRERISFAGRDAPPRVTPVYCGLVQVQGHVEVAQKDAVCVPIVARLLADSLPQSSAED